jgi:transcriptional regulator with XRE-family HTH domain
MEATQPFPIALRELIVEHDYATTSGTPNWSAFAARLDRVHYETLRRVAAGKRVPSPEVIEECARVLGVPPEYFLEYRVYLAQRDFDPGAIGLERAVQNLKTWAGAREGARVPRADYTFFLGSQRENNARSGIFTPRLVDTVDTS